MAENGEQVYERLAAAASLESADAAIVIEGRLAPIGGWESKVFPPSYRKGVVEQGERRSTYLKEDRLYGQGSKRSVVLLDAVQSQANRCETALREEVDAGRLAFPLLELTAEAGGRRVRITNLDAPHRSRDAYFRDSILAEGDGTTFDDSPTGSSLRAATEKTAGAYLRHAPLDLLYGAWDSHRGGRGARFARCYSSELLGHEPEEGHRAAGRYDEHNLVGDRVRIVPTTKEWSPLAPGEKPGKGEETEKLSEIGHGMIPPILEGGGSSLGGVTVSDIVRRATLGFAGLAKLRFGSPTQPVSAEADRAGRTLLAVLGLFADRLTFTKPVIALRSGCELVLESETLRWVMRGGTSEVLELDLDGARALLETATQHASVLGVSWSTETLRLRPKDNLQAVLERTYTTVELAPDE